MDADSPQGKELLRLLSAVCDGRGEASMIARIEELVRQNESAGELIIAFSSLHSDLCHSVSASHARRATSDALAEEMLGEQICLGDSTTHDIVSARSASRRTRFAWIATGVAAGIALASAWLLRPVSPKLDAPETFLAGITLVRPPSQVGQLSDASDAVWASGQNPIPGSILAQGDELELLKGKAQVSMSCGADVVLQAPCLIVLESADAVRLERGKLTAEVAPWAKGFVVETRGLKVTDLGTRFAVSAESSGVAEAHVLEGEVLAEPLKTQPVRRAPVRLNTGQAIRVNLRRGRVDQLDAQGDRFVDRVGSFRPLRSVEMWNTGYGLLIGEDDPHWRVRIHGKDADQSARAVVGRPDPIYLDNAPDESQWISVADGTTKGVKAYSKYTFSTTFDLTGFDSATVSLTGRVLADNAVDEIRLNGRRVDIDAWALDQPGVTFQSFHPIEIRDGFVPRVNRLEFDVRNTTFIYRNGRPNLDNPMGLRVEWQAFGRPLPEPSTADAGRRRSSQFALAPTPRANVHLNSPARAAPPPVLGL
jgi:hypothetical protein